MKGKRRQRKSVRKSAKLAVFILVVIICAALLEGAARITYHYQPKIRSILAGLAGGLAANLDPYEMVDEGNRGNWVLRPGYRVSLGELIESKEKTGNSLAAEYLQQKGRELGISASTNILEINEQGFKGPPIDKDHSRVRILTIGNSCTFGSIFDYYSYPRSLERELLSRNNPVEVINGGVEGYTPRNVLVRLQQFASLEPEITTIYIGWNALFSERPPVGVEKYLRFLWLGKKVWSSLHYRFGNHANIARELYERPKTLDATSPEIKFFASYTPSFTAELNKIIDGMESAGSRVVLITLPGLFVTDEAPTEKALEIGHLPDYTTNPFVLATLAEKYNEYLRGLARRRKITLIDLESWSRAYLRPRDQFFLDSVHLSNEGQELIGRYLASELDGMVKEIAERTMARRRR